MEHYILFIFLIILGAIIGLIAGLVGIGGTSLLIPALIWIFLKLNLDLNLAVKSAFGTGLVVSSVTALIGFLTHKSKIEIKWNLILPLTIALIIGAFCGSNLAHFIEGSVLLNIFILILFLISFYLIFNLQAKSVSPLELSFSAIVITGFGLGLIASLVGLGGGLFTIIVFNLVFRYPLNNILGISTFVQTLGALSASVGYVLNGYVNFPVALAMLITGIPFAQFGAKLAHKMEPALLRRVFGALLLLISAVLFMTKH